MRRIVKSVLLVLPTLVMTGTAGAYVISALETTSGPYGPSDTLVVDIWLDSEGEEVYGFELYVGQDPTVLSPNVGASERHPLPDEDAGGMYLSEDGAYWYITSLVLGGVPSVNQSLATLVFHVIDVPTSTLINPLFDYPYGPYGAFSGRDGTDVTGEVVLNPLHIPEPTTTTLMGLGLLGIFYASRRR